MAKIQRCNSDYHTGANAFGSLPNPTVMDHNLSYLRKTQTWENSTLLTTRLMGIVFKLIGNEPRLAGQFVVNPLFIESMMGYPLRYTAAIGGALPH